MNTHDKIELPPLRIPDLEDELTAVLCAAISWGGSVISSEEYVAAKQRFRAAVNAAIEADRKQRFENGEALKRYKECGADEEQDPIERLRFFCSLAMSGQDWLDSKQFFEDLIADRKRRGEPVAWRWKWKDLPDSGWQLSSVGGWRETDAIRAEPLYLAPIDPQPALDAADLAFIADELRQAGKNRAADLVLTAMACPTQPAEPVILCDCERGHNGMGMAGRECDCPGNNPQPAEPVKVPSDDDIRRVARDMYLAGDLVWLGFDKDENGEYTQPKISSANITLIRALLARYGSKTGEATKQQREIEESMRRGARLTDHRFKL